MSAPAAADPQPPSSAAAADHQVHQLGRKRRASALTRLIGYSAVRKGDPQPSIIVSVLTLENDPGIDHLRRTLLGRLVQMPRFRSRLCFEKKPARWEEVEVDPGYHFEVHGFGRKVSQSEVESVVSSMHSRTWDLMRPQWRITHVPEMEDGKCKVIVAISHAIGDGISLVNSLLFKLVDEAKELSEKYDEAVVGRRTRKPKLPLRTQISAYFWGVYEGYTSVFWKQDKPSPLKLSGPATEHKAVATSQPIELSRVKEIAKKIGNDVTVNDVLMAVLTKASAMYLRDIAQEHPENIKTRKMRVQFVVDVRKGKQKATEFVDPNNKFAFALLNLPLKHFDKNTELVLACKRGVDLKKCSPQPAIAGKASDRLLPVIPTNQMVDLSRSAINVGTFMVSNVPGPQQPVHLAGAKLDQMEFFLFSSVGLYFGMFSYNGVVSATVSLDKSIGVDAQTLVDFFPVAFETVYNDVCGFTAPKESKQEQPQSPTSTASPTLASTQ